MHAKTKLFLGFLSSPEQSEGASEELLDEAVSNFLTRGREAWPELALEDEAFLAHAAPRLSTAGGLLATLAEAEAGDLWLACACVTGSDAAQSAFVEAYTPLMRRALARFAKQGVDIDDVEQHMISYLLFAEGERKAAISNYSGRGPLAAYLRVSIVREAIRKTKAMKRTVRDDDAVYAAATVGDDPELEALKRLYRDQFKICFVEALQDLEASETLLIRYHYYSRLGVREIAALDGSSKSQVARQLSAIREKLMKETQRRLMAHVDLRQSEARSIIRLVRSQLDIGLSQYIK